MEKNKRLFLDKFLLYVMAIVCPILALPSSIIIGYGKEKNNFIDRIKIISLYEILSFLIIGFSFIFWSMNGLKISIFVLFILYIFLCGVVARKKNDYISRGIALGLFANHYALAIMQTSDESTSRSDNSYWPDSGLAVILMVFKALFILLVYLLVINVSSFFVKPNITELHFSETIIELPRIETPVVHNLSINSIHFIADTSLFLSEGNPSANTPPNMAEGSFEERLYRIADEINKILEHEPYKIFSIFGYSADIGNEENLFDLSEQRALRVRDILIDYGVPIDNLVYNSMGGTNNWGDNLTEETRRG